MTQTVFTGVSRFAFLSLSTTDCEDYEKVKAAVLKIHELVPEYYRFQLRTLKKSESQSYLEYIHKLCKVFGRWLKSSGVDIYAKLVELIILEQFKITLPKDIQCYLEEREVTEVQRRAASLADCYALTHKYFGTTFVNRDRDIKLERSDGAKNDSSKANSRSIDSKS